MTSRDKANNLHAHISAIIKAFTDTASPVFNSVMVATNQETAYNCEMNCFSKNKQDIQNYDQCATACHVRSERVRNKLHQDYSQALVKIM